MTQRNVFLFIALTLTAAAIATKNGTGAWILAISGLVAVIIAALTKESKISGWTFATMLIICILFIVFGVWG